MRSAKSFSADGISTEFAKAVWTRRETNGIDLKAVSSVTEQRVFVQKSDSSQVSDMSDEMEVELDNCDSKNMVAAGKKAASDVCCMLQEIQCVCKDGGVEVSTSDIEETELTRYCVEPERGNTKVLEQLMDM